MIKTKKHFIVFRLTAFLTLLTFIFTGSLSAQVPVPETGKISAAPLSPLSELKIPETLGTIETQHSGSADKPWVIYIQDAHAVLDAQKNIQLLIAYLQEHYGVNLVALEGAKGKLDPTLLKTFPDSFVKEKTMRGYWRRAELSGGEMAAIFSKQPAGFYGIENWDPYKENYQAYLRAIQNQPAVESVLTEWRGRLDAARKRTYSAPLNLFHEKVTAFRDEKSNLMELWKFLSEESAAEDFKPYPHLSRLFEVFAAEASGGKAENVDTALRKAAEAFKKKILPRLAAKQAMEFNRAYQEYSSSQLDPASFIHQCIDLAKAAGFSLKLTPEVKQILGTRETLSHIKGTRLFEELESYLSGRENSLIKSGEERKLAEQYAHWQLFQSLMRLELNRTQWETIKELEKANADDFKKIRLLELQTFLDFYKTAERRDQIFHENLQKLMSREKSRSAAVLTGGFHARGFEEALRQSGYSYAVILPKMESLRGEELYKDAMQGKFSFKMENGSSLYESFTRDAVKSLVSGLNEPDFRKNLKLWRDEVIRELAREGRLADAPRYTRYLDGLFKIYHDKFGARAPKSREEILKAVEESLRGLKKEKSNQHWEDFQVRFKTLSGGLRDLAAQKNLTQKSFTELWAQTMTPRSAGVALFSKLDASVNAFETYDLFSPAAEPEGLPAGTGYREVLENLAQGVTEPAAVAPEAKEIARAVRAAELSVGMDAIKDSTSPDALSKMIARAAGPNFAAQVLAAVRNPDIPVIQSGESLRPSARSRRRQNRRSDFTGSRAENRDEIRGEIMIKAASTPIHISVNGGEITITVNGLEKKKTLTAGQVMTVGRYPDANDHIQVDDDQGFLSRLQFYLKYDGTDWFIKHGGGQNSTLVNGRSVGNVYERLPIIEAPADGQGNSSMVMGLADQLIAEAEARRITLAQLRLALQKMIDSSKNAIVQPVPGTLTLQVIEDINRILNKNPALRDNLPAILRNLEGILRGVAAERKASQALELNNEFAQVRERYLDEEGTLPADIPDEDLAALNLILLELVKRGFAAGASLLQEVHQVRRQRSDAEKNARFENYRPEILEVERWQRANQKTNLEMRRLTLEITYRHLERKAASEGVQNAEILFTPGNRELLDRMERELAWLKFEDPENPNRAQELRTTLAQYYEMLTERSESRPVTVDKEAQMKMRIIAILNPKRPLTLSEYDHEREGIERDFPQYLDRNIVGMGGTLREMLDRRRQIIESEMAGAPQTYRQSGINFERTKPRPYFEDVKGGNDLLEENAGIRKKNPKAILDELDDEIDSAHEQLANEYGFIPRSHSEEVNVIYEGFEKLIQGYNQIALSEGQPAYRGKLFIVDSPEANAFAFVEHDDIYLHWGLVREMARFSQVEGKPLTLELILAVLAHELTHVMQHTSYQGLSWENINDEFSENSRAQAVWLMKRNAEFHADEGAVRLLTAAGMSPREVPRLLNLLVRITPQSTIEHMISSHPHPKDRAREMGHYLADPHTVTSNWDKPVTTLSAENYMKLETGHIFNLTSKNLSLEEIQQEIRELSRRGDISPKIKLRKLIELKRLLGESLALRKAALSMNSAKAGEVFNRYIFQQNIRLAAQLLVSNALGRTLKNPGMPLSNAGPRVVQDIKKTKNLKNVDTLFIQHVLRAAEEKGDKEFEKVMKTVLENVANSALSVEKKARLLDSLNMLLSVYHEQVIRIQSSSYDRAIRRGVPSIDVLAARLETLSERGDVQKLVEYLAAEPIAFGSAFGKETLDRSVAFNDVVHKTGDGFLESAKYEEEVEESEFYQRSVRKMPLENTGQRQFAYGTARMGWYYSMGERDFSGMGLYLQDDIREIVREMAPDLPPDMHDPMDPDLESRFKDNFVQYFFDEIIVYDSLDEENAFASYLAATIFPQAGSIRSQIFEAENGIEPLISAENFISAPQPRQVQNLALQHQDRSYEAAQILHNKLKDVTTAEELSDVIKKQLGVYSKYFQKKVLRNLLTGRQFNSLTLAARMHHDLYVLFNSMFEAADARDLVSAYVQMHGFEEKKNLDQNSQSVYGEYARQYLRFFEEDLLPQYTPLTQVIPWKFAELYLAFNAIVLEEQGATLTPEMAVEQLVKISEYTLLKIPGVLMLEKPMAADFSQSSLAVPFSDETNLPVNGQHSAYFGYFLRFDLDTLQRIARNQNALREQDHRNIYRMGRIRVETYAGTFLRLLDILILNETLSKISGSKLPLSKIGRLTSDAKSRGVENKFFNFVHIISEGDLGVYAGQVLRQMSEPQRLAFFAQLHNGFIPFFETAGSYSSNDFFDKLIGDSRDSADLIKYFLSYTDLLVESHFQHEDDLKERQAAFPETVSYLKAVNRVTESQGTKERLLQRYLVYQNLNLLRWNGQSSGKTAPQSFGQIDELQQLLKQGSFSRDFFLDLWERQLLPEVHKHTLITEDRIQKIQGAKDNLFAEIESFRSDSLLELPLEWQNLREQKFAIGRERAKELIDFYQKVIPIIFEPQRQVRFGATALKIWRQYSVSATFEQELRAIKAFFPHPTQMRDDALNSLFSRFNIPSPEAPRLLVLMAQKMYSVHHRLQFDEEMTNMDAGMQAMRDMLTGLPRADRKELILWIMDQDKFPIPGIVKDIEARKNIRFDRFTDSKGTIHYGLPDHFPYLPAFMQRKLMQYILTGENGVLNSRTEQDLKIKKEFAADIFDAIFPADKNDPAETGIEVKTLSLVRRIFIEAIGHFDQARGASIIEDLREIKSDLDRLSFGERLAALLGSFGPVGVKLGQILSENESWIPSRKLRKRLAVLKDNTKSFEKMAVVESYILQGFNLDQFSVGNDISRASVKQVHEGIYRDALGREEQVVFKEIRPALTRSIEHELEVLKKVFSDEEILSGVKELASDFDPDQLISSIGEALEQESNLLLEAQNTAELGTVLQRYQLAAEDEQLGLGIRVPKIFKASRSSIVEERITGIQLGKALTMKPVEIRRELIKQGASEQDAERASRLDWVSVKRLLRRNFLSQIFVDGIFHADPHGSNIMLDGNDLIYIDMGLVGRLTPEQIVHAKKFVKALLLGDTKMLVSSLEGILAAEGGRLLNHVATKKAVKRIFNKNTGNFARLLSELGVMIVNQSSRKGSQNAARLVKAINQSMWFLPMGLDAGEETLKDLAPMIDLNENEQTRFKIKFGTSLMFSRLGESFVSFWQWLQNFIMTFYLGIKEKFYGLSRRFSKAGSDLAGLKMLRQAQETKVKKQYGRGPSNKKKRSQVYLPEFESRVSTGMVYSYNFSAGSVEVDFNEEFFAGLGLTEQQKNSLKDISLKVAAILSNLDVSLFNVSDFAKDFGQILRLEDSERAIVLSELLAQGFIQARDLRNISPERFLLQQELISYILRKRASGNAQKWGWGVKAAEALEFQGGVLQFYGTRYRENYFRALDLYDKVKPLTLRRVTGQSQQSFDALPRSRRGLLENLFENLDSYNSVSSSNFSPSNLPMGSIHFYKQPGKRSKKLSRMEPIDDARLPIYLKDISITLREFIDLTEPRQHAMSPVIAVEPKEYDGSLSSWLDRGRVVATLSAVRKFYSSDPDEKTIEVTVIDQWKPIGWRLRFTESEYNGFIQGRVAPEDYDVFKFSAGPRAEHRDEVSLGSYFRQANIGKAMERLNQLISIGIYRLVALLPFGKELMVWLDVPIDDLIPVRSLDEMILEIPETAPDQARFQLFRDKKISDQDILNLFPRRSQKVLQMKEGAIIGLDDTTIDLAAVLGGGKPAVLGTMQDADKKRILSARNQSVLSALGLEIVFRQRADIMLQDYDGTVHAAEDFLLYDLARIERLLSSPEVVTLVNQILSRSPLMKQFPQIDLNAGDPQLKKTIRDLAQLLVAFDFKNLKGEDLSGFHTLLGLFLGFPPASALAFPSSQAISSKNLPISLESWAYLTAKGFAFRVAREDIRNGRALKVLKEWRRGLNTIIKMSPGLEYMLNHNGIPEVQAEFVADNTQRERYRIDKERSELPIELGYLAHAFDWPVDMSNQKASLGALFHEATIGTDHHGALDINAPAGTPVTVIEGGIVTHIQMDSRDPASQMVDITLYSPVTGLYWIYSHVSLRSLPEDGQKIGQWSIEQGPRLKAGHSLEIARFPHTRVPDHLHLAIQQKLSDGSLRPVNPLHALKRLYPETVRSESRISQKRQAQLQELAVKFKDIIVKRKMRDLFVGEALGPDGELSENVSVALQPSNGVPSQTISLEEPEAIVFFSVPVGDELTYDLSNDEANYLLTAVLLAVDDTPSDGSLPLSIEDQLKTQQQIHQINARKFFAIENPSPDEVEAFLANIRIVLNSVIVLEERQLDLQKSGDEFRRFRGVLAKDARAARARIQTSVNSAGTSDNPRAELRPLNFNDEGIANRDRMVSDLKDNLPPSLIEFFEKLYPEVYLANKEYLYTRKDHPLEDMRLLGMGFHATDQVLVPAVVDELFERAKTNPKTRLVFLEAGAHPLTVIAETMARVTGDFPVDRIHNIWATMGMDTAIKKREMDPADFVRYLQQEGALSDTDRIIYADTDTRDLILGTETIFYRTLMNREVMTRLGLPVWNSGEDAPVIEGLFMRGEDYSGLMDEQIIQEGFDLKDYRDRVKVIPFGMSNQINAPLIASLYTWVDYAPKTESVRPVLINEGGRVALDKRQPYGQMYEGDEQQIYAALHTAMLRMGTLDILEARGYDVSKETEYVINALKAALPHRAESREGYFPTLSQALTNAPSETNNNEMSRRLFEMKTKGVLVIKNEQSERVITQAKVLGIGGNTAAFRVVFDGKETRVLKLSHSDNFAAHQYAAFENKPDEAGWINKQGVIEQGAAQPGRGLYYGIFPEAVSRDVSSRLDPEEASKWNHTLIGESYPDSPLAEMTPAKRLQQIREQSLRGEFYGVTPDGVKGYFEADPPGDKGDWGLVVDPLTGDPEVKLLDVGERKFKLLGAETPESLQEKIAQLKHERDELEPHITLPFQVFRIHRIRDSLSAFEQELLSRNESRPLIDGTQIMPRIQELLSLAAENRPDTPTGLREWIYFYQLALMHSKGILTKDTKVFNVLSGFDLFPGLFGSEMWTSDYQLNDNQVRNYFDRTYEFLAKSGRVFGVQDKTVLPARDQLGTLHHDSANVLHDTSFTPRWASQMKAGDVVLLKFTNEYLSMWTNSLDEQNAKNWLNGFLDAIPAGVRVVLYEREGQRYLFPDGMEAQIRARGFEDQTQALFPDGEIALMNREPYLTHKQNGQGFPIYPEALAMGPILKFESGGKMSIYSKPVRAEVRNEGLVPESRSESREETVFSLIPEINKLENIHSPALTPESLESVILAAAEKKRADFDAAFDLRIQNVLQSLKGLDQETFDSFIYGGEGTLDAFTQFLETALNGETPGAYLSHVQLYGTALGIRVLVTLGENPGTALPAMAVGFNYERIEADTAAMIAAIKAFAGGDHPLVRLLINNPDDADLETVQGGLETLQHEGLLEHLDVAVQPGESFLRKLWNQFRMSVFPARADNINSVLETRGEITGKMSGILLTNDLPVSGKQLGMFAAVAKIKQIPDAKLRKLAYVSILYAMVRAVSLGGYEKFQTRPELLREEFNKDPLLVSLMSLDPESGNFVLGLAQLTARYAAVQAAQRAA